MKILLYYATIFTAGVLLFLAAGAARKKEKPVTAYICYFGIFLEVLLFI